MKTLRNILVLALTFIVFNQMPDFLLTLKESVMYYELRISLFALLAFVNVEATWNLLTALKNKL